MRFIRQEPEEFHINLTPLIDVVFLLLLFFMVTTSFKQQSVIDVNLPNATPSATITDPLSLIVRVDENEGISFATHQSSLSITNVAEKTLTQQISNAIVQLKKQYDKKNSDVLTVIVEADKNARHGQIIAILDALAALEINEIQFAIDPPVNNQ